MAHAFDEAIIHTGELGRVGTLAYASNKKQASFLSTPDFPAERLGFFRGLDETRHGEEFDTSTVWPLTVVLLILFSYK